MGNMDLKLGEWFKQVEKREKELKAKKKDGDEQPAYIPQTAGRVEPVINNVEILEPAAQAQSSVVATLTAREVIADTSIMDLSEISGVDTRNDGIASNLSMFDEDEIPQVEDFFSFMGETGDPKPIVRDDEEPPLDIPTSRRSLGTLGPLNILSEGTGEPRPIAFGRDSIIPPVAAPEAVVETKPALAPKKIIAEKQVEKTAAKPSEMEENWARMPAHLQILFGNPAAEVAQNSYKAFKEGRGEMIQRLLDPQLTLEEAARILNVCPTTVRRYTNRGSLKHLRTAGNQRRFRLSDVLAFMESSAGKASKK